MRTNGTINADPTRFPGGIKALADYVHSRGLKFGVYTAQHAQTCQDRPGSYMHEAIDVESYCNWGVDYLKIDACRGAGYAQHNTSWIKFRAAIDACSKKRGFPIVMSVESCDDPSASGCGAWIGKLANLWRTGGDIQAYFGSVMGNAAENTKMAAHAGPTGGPLGGGRWNDPDMLQVCVCILVCLCVCGCVHVFVCRCFYICLCFCLFAISSVSLSPSISFSHTLTPLHNGCPQVGDIGLSLDEQRSHFALWNMMAAPLLIGADVSMLSNTSLEILGNGEITAIDQDAKGVQGVPVGPSAKDAKTATCWAKPLADGGVAALLLNVGDTEATITCSLKDLGVMQNPTTVRDLWAKADVTPLPKANGVLTANLASHANMMVRIST